MLAKQASWATCAASAMSATDSVTTRGDFPEIIWECSKLEPPSLGLFPPLSGLTAQLQRDALQRLAGRLRDELSHLGGAGKGDLVDLRVGHQSGSGRRSIAGDHVDHSGRKAGFNGELGDGQGAQWRLLGRLEDEGVAGCQRWGPFPAIKSEGLALDNWLHLLPRPPQHEGGVVPRHHAPNHAHWFNFGVADDGPIRGDRLSVNLIRPAGVVAERIDGAVNVELGFGQWFSVVQSLKVG